MAEDRVQVLVRVRPILASEQATIGLDPKLAASVSQPAIVVAADGETVRAELPIDFTNEKIISSSSAPSMTCKLV